MSNEWLDMINYNLANIPEEVEDTSQGSDYWKEQRRGKLTGSKFDTLMKTGRKKDDRFSKQAMNYIYEKVAEVITESTHEVSSSAMAWGSDHEYQAIEKYMEIKNVVVDPCGFIEFNSISGSSPDGLVGEHGCVEVKCPFNPANHAKVLLTNEVPEDYIFQVQGHMMVTGRKWCDFISFDPRVQDEALAIVIIRVPRDEELIKVLKDRIKEAEELIKKLIKQLQNEQSNSIRKDS